MIKTNVLHHNSDPNNTSPRSNPGPKWVTILSPIWGKYKKARWGKGIVFILKFFNMDELVSNPKITPSDYKDLYTLFLFDVSKQSEKLKYSTTGIQIKMHFSAGIPANTQAYAVIISDRLINFHLMVINLVLCFKNNNFFLFKFFFLYIKNEC